MKLWAGILFLLYSQMVFADPYETITRKEFDNGLEVYFSPGPKANTVTILIEVETGWDNETKQNLGVAHLLEHTLFRHDSLPTNMSFMEVVKEEGGDGNGYTMAEVTQYFTTIKSDKAEWLLDWYSKLIIDRKIIPDYVEKGKREVMLEIGEKDNELERFIKQVTNPIELPKLDFWRTEFGVSEKPYNEDLVRDNTLLLNSNQVQSFYDTYYHPQNMKVFVAGNFDQVVMLQKITETFGVMKRTNVVGKTKKVPKPRNRPFDLSVVAESNSYIEVGTKVWDIESVDEMVLRSYLGFLAHRLMKDIRNVSGETYTVLDKVELVDRFGFGVIMLESTREQFKKNLENVKNYITKEAQNGGISDIQIREAKKIFLKQFERIDTDSKSLLDLADSKRAFYYNYKEQNSPYQILKNVSEDEYRLRLAKMFSKNQEYQALSKPPLFFRGDQIVLGIIFSLLFFLGFKNYLLSTFEHLNIRYVRKIKYSPLTIFAFLTLIYFPILFTELYHYALLWVWDFMNLRSSLLINVYGATLVNVFGVVGIVMGYLAFWPRKLIVMDNHFVVKSLTYYSFKIPFTDVESIKIIKPFELFSVFSPRFRFIDFALLRKGIYLKTRSGLLNRYFFGFKDAEKVLVEINSAINKNNELKIKTVA